MLVLYIRWLLEELNPKSRKNDQEPLLVSGTQGYHRLSPQMPLKHSVCYKARYRSAGIVSLYAGETDADAMDNSRFKSC